MYPQEENDKPKPPSEESQNKSETEGTDAGARPAKGASTATQAPRDIKSEKVSSVKTEDAAAARPANYKWVGAQVRSMYDNVLHEPIPDGFMDLLRQAYDKKTPDKS